MRLRADVLHAMLMIAGHSDGRSKAFTVIYSYKCDCGVESHEWRLFYLVLCRFKRCDTEVHYSKSASRVYKHVRSTRNRRLWIYLASSATQMDEDICFMLNIFQ